MLEGSKRNRNVFNKIAREMEVAGYDCLHVLAGVAQTTVNTRCHS